MSKQYVISFIYPNAKGYIMDAAAKIRNPSSHITDRGEEGYAWNNSLSMPFLFDLNGAYCFTNEMSKLYGEQTITTVEEYDPSKKYRAPQ